MRIAVDVDGVLADHVSAVLSRLRAENDGFSRTNMSMTHWDEPLPELGTSLKPAIEAAESDPEFVRNIPPVKGAVQGTTELVDQGHELIIVTARPRAILPDTHEWLEANSIPHNYEEILSTDGQMKTVADTTVLIDDYPGHVNDFANAGRYAILFVQPWNRSEVDDLIESANIFAAEDWEEVVDVVQSLSEKFEL
ncbi:5' nucleotidase, NT5C type (plasmid) [Haloarcula salina]|uniref:5' nucleotidase, NT5C type n=1 Tax=Haloarcula salina TaxID=1429914 RepID=UPI003C70169B